TITGFKDLNLTEEEKEIIEIFNNPHEKFLGREWKKVRIGDLFNIQPTKNYGMTNDKLFETKGKTPVIVNSSFNNGVGGYVDLEPLEKGGIITFSDTTTSDAIFYQPRDFIGYSHVQGMYPYDKWTKRSLKYFCLVFRNHTKGLFNYGFKFNRAIAKELLITLPFINGKLDFLFMESFIKTIEKLVIKDVIAFLDKKIKATKTVINRY
ncbi:MAG: restriction endonuclease subunit S, partial [Treponema sp.]